jgi:hypothetical protein
MPARELLAHAQHILDTAYHDTDFRQINGETDALRRLAESTLAAPLPAGVSWESWRGDITALVDACVLVQDQRALLSSRLHRRRCHLLVTTGATDLESVPEDVRFAAEVVVREPGEEAIELYSAALRTARERLRLTCLRLTPQPSPLALPPQPDKPRWDRPRQVLTVGADTVKYGRIAPAHFWILDAFEAKGWPNQMPTPRHPSGRVFGVKDTICTLNRKVFRSCLRFTRTENDTTIGWHFTV